MSFRTKLTLIFSTVLLLIATVAITSWWGMGTALESQNKLHGFQYDIERSFHKMILHEQEFTQEEKLSHSRSVYARLNELEEKIQHVSSGIDERQLVDHVLKALRNYEQNFARYIQQILNQQTSKSRLFRESSRLVASTEEFSSIDPATTHFHRLITRTLQAEKNFIINPRLLDANIVKDSARLIEQKAQEIRLTADDDAIKLKAFRIAKVAAAYKNIFDDFATQHTLLELARFDLHQALDHLRDQLANHVTHQASLTQKRINNLQLLILLTSALAAGLSFIVTLTLSAFITRPINRLKQSAQKIVDGNLDATVEVDSKDEIGELGNIFNRMSARLKKNFDTLTEYRDHLEERVRERTRDLEQEINERRQAEEALLVSEQKFRKFFDNATDGILIIDPGHHRFIAANPMICTMLAFDKDELLALSPADIHPAGKLPAIEKELQREREGKKRISKDVTMLRKDGSDFLAEVTATRIEIDKQPFIMANFRDVSERKQMEEERLKIRKLESVGILAGGIAHDFNNILAAILGNVSLSLALTPTDDNRHKLLKEVEKASLRARDLTQQLLTFSKGGEPIKTLASIKDIITESAQFILRGSNVRCDIHCPEELWGAEVDPGQISQVIQNIVTNGRHAMPTGGIINIACENCIPDEARSLPLAGQRCLEIRISDTGIGIPKDMLARIFDPYFTTKQEGSGLGLAITHSIISKHDGQITVSSTPGSGTTFTILLPAVDSVFNTTGSELAPRQLPGGDCIMVMDDEQAVRDVAGEMLIFLGYSVVLVADGKEAIDEYHKRIGTEDEIALIIMDLTIPGGMGGEEAVTKILEINQEAKVVVSSGYSHDPIMSQFEKYGFVGVINKPFQLQDLQTMLESILTPSSNESP